MMLLLLVLGSIHKYDMIPSPEITIYSFTQDTAREYFSIDGEPSRLYGIPEEVASPPGDNSLFIVDRGWNKIGVIEIDSESNIDTVINYGRWGTGEGRFNKPSGIAVTYAPSGANYTWDIYVVDTGNNRVVRLGYRKDIHYLFWLNEVNTVPGNPPTPLSSPSDVAAFWKHPDKGPPQRVLPIYIVDRGNNRILKYYRDLSYPYYFYTGSGDNRLNNPRSIAVYPNGISEISYDIYVCDDWNRIVYLREDDDTNIPEWISEIRFPEGRILSVATDGKGVYAVDERNSKLIVLSRDLGRVYFVYGSYGKGSDNLFFPRSVGCDSIGDGYKIGVVENYTRWSGFKTFWCDYSDTSEDTPVLTYTYDGHKKLVLHIQDRCSKEKEYQIWKKLIGSRWTKDWFIKERINSSSGNLTFTDTVIPEGDYTIYYKVRGAATDFRTRFSNIVTVHGPRCYKPTITSLTFQDSVVVIEWNDNSRKNKEYYVGKLVHGQSSYTGHDTTFWYHMGHYLGDATSFIDTFPIEGENIYRVAAIDSTNYYWYSDYDTINIPFYKADSFMALSLPDTSILFRWRDRTYLESGYALKEDSLTGTIGIVPADSCAFLYSDADTDTHRYYLVSWQKRDGVYFYWAICDSLDYQWKEDNEPPVLSVYGGGRVIGEDSVRIEWDAEDNNGIKEIWVNDVRLPYNIRGYTYKGDYAGWYDVNVKVKDFWGYEVGSGVMAGIYYKDSVDISGFLSVQSNKAPGKGMYFVYGDIPETGYYKVYYCINSKSWHVVDNLHLYEGSNGRVLLSRAGEGDTVSAFMCMEEGDRFRHYSDYKSKVWSTGGGGGGGCPYLYVWTGKDYEFDNSLLPESEHKVGVFKDHYILTKRPSGDGIRLKIKEWDDWTFIDRVRLFRVLHPESVGIGIYRDKLIGYVEVEEVKRAYDNLGFEWTDSVRTTGMGAYMGRKGKNGKLFTEFGIKGDYILAGTKAAPPPPPKLTFASGKDTLFGRVIGSEYLTVTGEFEVLDSVGVIDYVRSVRKVSSRYVKKTSLKPEEIPDEMRRKDGRYYIIEPGDSVEIRFRRGNRPIPEGWVEDYMIEVIGFYTKPGKALGGVYGMIKEPSLLVNFGKELWFSAGGIKGGTVEVEVYDITGRCVRRMEVKAGSPGRITGLPSGVYFVHIGERTFKGVIVK